MKKFTSVTGVEVRAERWVPGGQVLGELSAGDAAGKKIFFWNALPGEVVTTFTPTKIKSHFVEAIADQVATPAPARVAPRDAGYLATSPWQIVDFAAELQAKGEIVTECFRQHGVSLPGPVSVASDGREYFYRNKMEYSLYFDHADGRIYPAFHRRGSHRKFPVQGSSLERPAIWERASAIVAKLNATGADARQFQSLMLRASQSDQVEGGLFVNHQPHPQFPELTDTLLGHTYTYSPNGFFQINLPVYELALRAMQPFVTTEKVLDLFAGVGTIGLSIAREAELTLVECDRAAHQELAKNAAAAPRARAVLAKSEEVLDFISADATVIVDPPRAGCAPELIERLTTVAPPTLIYLSCNPATQARDVAALLTAGKYQIAHAEAFNFFPHTPHIENLVVLQRASR